MTPKLLFVALLLCQISSPAQFTGLGSYWQDSLYNKLIKAQKVRTVTQRIPQYNNAFNGRYTFDTEGRVIETMSGSQQKMQYEYLEKGIVSKVTYFEEHDTTKVNSWVATTYDKKYRVVKEVNGSYDQGKLNQQMNFETKILSEQNGKTRSETNHYYAGKVIRTVYTLDSTAGIYEFTIRYEHEPENVDKKGRKQGKKFTERRYVKDNCFYEDEIKYAVNGRLEIVENIETRYHKTDAKGRTIEFGQLDYEEALSAYVEQHPEEMRFYTIPLGFIKAIMDGKTKGQTKADAKFTFDAKGLLMEKYFYESNFKFKYNQKNQLIETLCEGLENYSENYFYNEKGLIQKTTSTFQDPNGENGSKKTNETIYFYDYY